MEPVKPSSLRKYIFEYALICLGASVSFLYYQYNDLNRYIRETLTNQNIETRNALIQNTKALEQANNFYLNRNR